MYSFVLLYSFYFYFNSYFLFLLSHLTYYLFIHCYSLLSLSVLTSIKIMLIDVLTSCQPKNSVSCNSTKSFVNCLNSTLSFC